MASLRSLVVLALSSIHIPSVVAQGEPCHTNNCLRALRGKSASAVEFCSQYTVGPYTSVLPTYVAACSMTGIASACSCLSPATSTTPTTTSTTTSTAQSEACTPSTVYVTLASDPVTVTEYPPEPTCDVGPYCQPVNSGFEDGMCGWNPTVPDGSIGTTVHFSNDRSFAPLMGESMWRSAGSTGVQQNVRFCDTNGYCVSEGRFRTLDESCSVSVCWWKDFDDPYGFICERGYKPDDMMVITAEEGWGYWDFQLKRPEGGPDPVGELWTFSIFTSCQDLYVDRIGGGCQK